AAAPGSVLHAKIRWSLATCHASLGEIRRAIELLPDAVARFEELGDHDALDDALEDHAHLLARVGRYDEAVAILERSLEIAKSIDDVPCLISVWLDLATIAAERGEVAKA